MVNSGEREREREYHYYFLCNHLVPRIMRLESSGRNIRLRKTNMTTLNALSPIIDTVNIGNGESDANSTSNIMFYRPRFNDGMNSNLAALFINLEVVYPCIQPINRVNGYYPICRAFTDEEDGFRGGRSVLDTGDIGNGRFRIFSATDDIATYALAIQRCPTWTTACFPDIHSFSIVCYLPRNVCM